MRLTSTLLFILSFSYSISCFSQMKVGDMHLDFGNPVTTESGDVIQIAGESNNITYALAKENKTHFIQTFRVDNQDFIKSKEIELDKIGRNKVALEDMVVVGTKPYVFASYYDKDSKEQKFIAYLINDDLSLEEPVTILAEAVEKRSQGGFIFKLSYDESSYMVMYIDIDSRDEKMSYSFTLLDESLKSLHKDKVVLQFEDKKDLDFSLDDVTVNKEGDIFVVISDSYRDKKKKDTYTNLSVYTYYARNNYEKEIINVDLKGKKVVNCDALYTQEGKLQLIGFYSNLRNSGRSESRIEGVFNVVVNTGDNSLGKEVFNEFTFETKKKLIGERRAKKGKDLLPYYRNTHFIERDNGGVIVLSEWYTTLVGRSSGIGPLSFTPITYSTNEIIITALNEDGTLDWSNVLPKEQQVTVTQFSLGFAGLGGGGNFSVGAGVFFPIAILGEGPEYLSSVPMYDKGVLTLLVNDDPKNIGVTDIDDVKKVRNVKKMIPVVFNFNDKDGSMTRVDPEDFEKRQLVVRPFVNYRIGSNSYLVYATNKEGKHLGTLSIQE